jgi:hypothetical protein
MQLHVTTNAHMYARSFLVQLDLSIWDVRGMP